MTSVAVEITGHLAETPDLRVTNNGVPVTSFTVMANARRYDEDRREWVDAHTTAIRVTAWNTLAVHAVDSLTRGALVTVSGGRLTADAWTDREGTARATLELRADSIRVDLGTQTVAITRAPRIPAA
ncbi:single-stranded DNA-binding protein [Nocardia africana]|uniref:Single-stranded DNA-binding protein n=1 Tax=Nocardia africana TaxID=134964 RepID=A0A379X5M6_9NOCA|nr:single-stranded DNA-binding protein [Nocardia africana]MCC3318482.1 single-stranded DNA-binding protein [Nocardia africana]SUH72006.1 Helix-destabilizing protein [Nocardia africana]